MNAVGQSVKEITFCMIKPRGIKYRQQIKEMIEKRGLVIEKIRFIEKLSLGQVEELYAEHKEKEWFHTTTDYFVNKSVIVLIISGDNAVSKMREIIGATDPINAEENTIRGRFGLKSDNLADRITDNIIHGCAKPEFVTREQKIFFE